MAKETGYKAKPKTTAKARAKSNKDKVAQTRAEEAGEDAEKNVEPGLWDKPEDIMLAIKAKQSEMEALRTRMDEDFDIYRQDEYEAKAGYESYTSTAPKNFFDKILHGINQANLTINIKTQENADRAERDAANSAELYLIGALNDVDRINRKKRVKALRRALGFMACLRGWVAIRCLVYVPKGEKDTIFEVSVWDMMHVTWEDGPKGPLWIAYQRKATRAQVHAEYGVVIGKADAMITDFWSEEKNCVILDSGEFLKDPVDHGIGHVPAWIGNVGDMPDIQTKDFEGAGSQSINTLEFQGESVWTTPKGIIEPRNRYISQLMDTAKRAVAGSLVHKSKNGKKKIKGDPYASFIEIPISEDEEITPLVLPSAPPETAAILSVFDHDWQSSTLPYPLSYGGTSGAAESGRALAIRIDNTRSAYSPRTSLVQEAYQWLCEELLTQFANPARKTKKIQLHGNDPKTEEYFVNEYKPSELKRDWIVEVKVEPRLPRDQETEINMALAASRGDQQNPPILSMRTVRKDIIQTPNPDLEDDRVLVQQGKMLPPIQMRLQADAMQRAGDEEGAQLVLEYAQGLELSNRENLAAAEQQAPPPGAEQPQEAPVPTEQEMNILEQVFQVLEAIGAEELMEELAGALSGQVEPGPTLIDEIIEILVQNGQQELAEQFVAQLQGGGEAPPVQ